MPSLPRIASELTWSSFCWYDQGFSAVEHHTPYAVWVHTHTRVSNGRCIFVSSGRSSRNFFQTDLQRFMAASSHSPPALSCLPGSETRQQTPVCQHQLQLPETVLFLQLTHYEYGISRSFAGRESKLHVINPHLLPYELVRHSLHDFHNLIYQFEPPVFPSA